MFFLQFVSFLFKCFFGYIIFGFDTTYLLIVFQQLCHIIFLWKQGYFPLPRQSPDNWPNFSQLFFWTSTTFSVEACQNLSYLDIHFLFSLFPFYNSRSISMWFYRPRINCSKALYLIHFERNTNFSFRIYSISFSLIPLTSCTLT